MKKLDELLQLEKATNIVFTNYGNMASGVYQNGIEHELQKKYKKYGEMHSKIIDEIEVFLDEYFKEN